MGSDDSEYPRQHRSWLSRSFSNPAAGSQRSSVFNLISGCVGMGILILPYCMMKVGLLCFLVVIAISGVASYASLRICCAGMQATGAQSYVDTLMTIFSKRIAILSTYMLVIACFGCCCGYMVFASQLVHQLLSVIGVASERWVIVGVLACFPVLPMSFLKNLSDFRYLSILSLCGLMYLSGLVFSRASYYLRTSDAIVQDGWWWKIPDVWSIPKCLSLCFTAYVVHMSVFSTYKELVNPTGRRITKVIFRSVVGETVLYIAIGICGFLSFGTQTKDNILQDYDLNDVGANIGRLVVSWQLLMALPLTVHPARIYTWALIVLSRRRQDAVAAPGKGSAVSLDTQYDSEAPMVSMASTGDFDNIPEVPHYAHTIITIALVVLSALVAMAVESASDLLGIVGGFAAMTYAFLLPGEMGNAMRNRSKNRSLVIDWANSPAPFLNDAIGPFAINGLRVCSAIGYLASIECVINLIKRKS